MSVNYDKAKENFARHTKMAAIFPKIQYNDPPRKDRHAEFVPKQMVGVSDEPALTQVLSGYKRRPTKQDLDDALSARPDLWTKMSGVEQAEICGHFIPKWLWEKFAEQNGLSAGGMRLAVIEDEESGRIDIVRGGE